MKKFTSLRLLNLPGNTGLVKLVLVVLLGLAAGIGKAQTNFASAVVLNTSQSWGSVVYTNRGISRFNLIGDPGIAGYAPNAPVWYQWTAPDDGEVVLDTLDANTNLVTPPVDTVLAVFTGTSLSTLSQVAANDDLYPVSQLNEYGANIFNMSTTNLLVPNIYGATNPYAAAGTCDYYQPFAGPSGLRFNATYGTTYYFVVDTKRLPLDLYLSDFNDSPNTNSPPVISQPTGRVVLNWAFHSSGVFRFATEDVDQLGFTNKNGMPLLLYRCAETESVEPVGEFGNVDAKTVVHTYYHYNAPGMLVTVTRVAGSSGRVSVDYRTVGGITNQVSGDVGAMPGLDYGDPLNFTELSGTLVFDDFEMSKTILIPIISDNGVSQPNRDFMVVLTNAQYVANEHGQVDDVSPPRVDPAFGKALVRILDVDIDPKGASEGPITYSTNLVGVSPNFVTNIVTNLPVWCPIPTNAVLNFQKAHYRVGREGTNFWGATPVTVYVNRTGTNTATTTANWRINNYFLQLQTGYDQQNMIFPLQPGSDYAMPDPTNANSLVMGMAPPDSPEFTNSSGNFGTLTWGDKDFRPKAIHFTVYNNGQTEFNHDLSLQLYRTDAKDSTIADQLGMVAETTVTILFDDQFPPPGSVDELYNADFNSDLALSNIPVTMPSYNTHPGANGEVDGLAILPNNETVIVGNFSSFNGNTLNCIAVLTTNGMPDSSFNPSSGANKSINAVGLTSSGKYVIGGAFTSFNGQSRVGIGRVNADGSLDTSFNPGTGAVGGAVRAVLVQPNGQVLVGGDFTNFNGTVRNHIARLNTDGSVDATFNPGTNIIGSVRALALQPSGGGQILVGGGFAVGGQGYDNIALLNSNGSLNTSFNPGTGPDNWVYALCWQPNGQMLLGGNFDNINGTPLYNIARLNANGSIDTTGFFSGTGADDTVRCLFYATNIISTLVVSNPPPGGGLPVTNQLAATNYNIYVGGSFTSFNGTRRLGFTRLYTDGTVDTTFMDTAYNQFAGLPRIYLGDTPGAVYAAGLQSDGDVMIAGAFTEVGGGEADMNVRNTDCNERGVEWSFGDPHLLVSENKLELEPKARDGVHNRNNVARLIGGTINGQASLTSLRNAYAPGNIGLLYNSYSANESQSFLNVSLARANGALGPAGANFALQPGLARSGVDYVYNANEPLWWVAWENTSLVTRMHAHGFFGTNGILEDIYGRFFWNNYYSDLTATLVTVYPDQTVRGNLNAQFQLANPAGADQFYLGGVDIPLGVALGNSSASFTLIDDNNQSGQFSFAGPIFIATNASSPAAISVVRSNGTYGTVTMDWSTGTNGTAVSGSDYTPRRNVPISFSDGDLSYVFNVAVMNSGFIYTNMVEKTVNLVLSDLQGGNATFGLSNAVLRLINPGYKGYLSFSAGNYTANESSGYMTVVVNRTSGSQGNLSVQYVTADGTGPNSAFSNADYTLTTGTLRWTGGDVSPRIVTIPLINTLAVSPNKHFTISLLNPTNNGAADPTLMGLITTATNTIIDDNSYGTVQFSAPSYIFNENGGYATIPVTRTGGAVAPVVVYYSTADGPFPNGAKYNVNYYPTSGYLTFATNQSATNIIVQLIDDGKKDATNGFYFTVSLSPYQNVTLGSPSTAIVNILDWESYTSWYPGTPGTGTNSISSANGSVLALALQPNGQLLVGGNFTQINNVPEYYIARLNANGTLDTTFPNVLDVSGANGSVNTLVCQTDGRILAGGSFTSMNGVFFNGIARLMTDGSLDSSFNPGAGADGPVNALAETFVGGVRAIYVGGAFNRIYNWSVPTPGIARLNNDGTVDTSFATGSGADGAISAIAVYPTNSIYAGKVLIGGAFTHYNGTNVNYIARLNADGSVDTSFSAAASNAVSAIAIQLDGRLLVGGSFIQFNNTSLNRIARLNADGSLDTNFVANVGSGVNNTVTGIALQPDNRIVLVGQFSQFNGLTCNRIVRLLPTGALDTSIGFGDGANSDVDAVVIQPWNGMIVIGGAFTQFNDQPYNHLVRLYGGSGVAGGGSLVLPAGSTLEYESFTPHNSIIDPGETVVVSFAFTNSSGNNVNNLVATLLATNGITSPSGPQTNQGVLVAGGPAVSLPFYFTASGTNGQTIAATFQLASSTTNLSPVVFTYLLGILTNSFVNTNAIIINDLAPAPAPYLATPYPSVINVNGVGGTLLNVTATFSNLTHSWPADIDALLESPSQQSALLMANAGGGYAVKGVTLTFNNATNYSPLLQNGQIVSGTYQPTAYYPVTVFPGPAPSAPYSLMSGLYAGNPNGGWSLFVIDDTPLNAGAISNGWSLNFVTASPVATQPVQIGNLLYSSSTFQFTFTGPLYSTIVQVSTNLSSTNWVTVYSNPVNWMLAYTNGTSSFTFTDAHATNRARFYRVIPSP